MGITEKAIEYARKGFQVFPCHISKAPKTNNGFKDASNNVETVYNMFKNKDSNLTLIGCVPGKDFFVWDIDLKDHEIDKNLYPQSGYPFLVTKTQNGGLHFCFRTNKTIPTKNKVKQGLDFRGNDQKGYFILPDENYYETLFVDDFNLSESPQETLKIVRKGNANPKKQKERTAPHNFSVKEKYYDQKQQKSNPSYILEKKGFTKNVLDGLYNNVQFQLEIAQELINNYGKEPINIYEICEMGVTSSFRSLIIGHKDENPSTRFSFGTDSNGYRTNTLLYIDYSNHLEIPNEEFACDLIHLFFHLKTGKFKLLSKYEKAVWGFRMLYELNFIQEKNPSLKKIRNFHSYGIDYQSFHAALELLSLRFAGNLVELDDGTVPLSRQFIQEWCFLSQPKARALLSFLVRTGQLKLEKIENRVRIYRYIFSERGISGFWRHVIMAVWSHEWDIREDQAFYDFFSNWDERQLLNYLC